MNVAKSRFAYADRVYVGRFDKLNFDMLCESRAEIRCGHPPGRSSADDYDFECSFHGIVVFMLFFK
jgi:hypothetical protein